MPEPRNLIVAQSGGPSPVINNSLRGLVETARELAEIGTVYAGWHGIEGVLKEELLDLSAQDGPEVIVEKPDLEQAGVNAAFHRGQSI